jgi:shikimate kinase
VYLKTMVTTASKRAASDDTRPVLAGEDPLEQMRNLLREREPIYSRADAEVKNDTRTPESVADEIVTLAKEKAGWS